MSNIPTNFYPVIAAIVAMIVIVAVARKTARGQYLADAVKLVVPILRELERKKSLRQYTLAYVDILNNNANKNTAISDINYVAANYISNSAFRKRAMRVAKTCGMESSVSDTLEKSGMFSPLIVEMVKTSEKQSTSARNSMLKKVSEFYREEADAAASALTAIIEPVAVCIAGALVFGVLALFYTGALSGAAR